MNGTSLEHGEPGATGPGGEAAAWFGKLSGVGDFATRRLPQDTARVLDRWLAQGVETSRLQLGARWLDAYLTSPLWRFAWAPGVLDVRWWFGLMMPSVDNVGRYFPLVVLQARAEPPAASGALNGLEQWYAAIAQAGLQTLQPGGSLDRFELDLARVAHDTPLPASLSAPSWDAAQWPQRSRYEVPEGLSLAASLQELAVAESLRRYRGCSLWWSPRPGAPGSSLSVAVGLPTRESFVHFLDGTW